MTQMQTFPYPTVIPAKAGIQTPVCPGKQQPARNLRTVWLPHTPAFRVREFGFPPRGNDGERVIAGVKRQRGAAAGRIPTIYR